MDLWGRLIGKKEQTLVVVEGEDWFEVTPSRPLDRTLDRRAAKEQWKDAEGGHAFHVLVTRSDSRDQTSAGILLEVVVNGVVTDRLGHDTADHAIEQMRVNDTYAAAAQALARLGSDGHWQLRVLL